MTLQYANLCSYERLKYLLLAPNTTKTLNRKLNYTAYKV